MKTCEFCGLKIDDDLNRCPYCGADLSQTNNQEIKPEEIKKEKDIRVTKRDADYYFDSYEELFKETIKRQEELEKTRNNKVSVGWLLAGIFIPVLGLIFALTFGRNNLAIRSKSFKGFIIGLIISVVVQIIFDVIIFILYQNGYLDQFFQFDNESLILIMKGLL